MVDPENVLSARLPCFFGMSLSQEQNRVAGSGGCSGGPAKHCAMDIHCFAVSPSTCRFVSATFRVCVTTWQKAVAGPSTRHGSVIQTANWGALSRASWQTSSSSIRTRAGSLQR
jgi:hypothetical protein